MQKFRAVKVYPYPEAAQKFREQNPNGGNIAYYCLIHRFVRE